MFDMSDREYNSVHTMLGTMTAKLAEFRKVFYSEDLSLLEDFTVVANAHADMPLGVYVVHNNWVEIPFYQSDDFYILFSIAEYNRMKLERVLTKEYSYYEQLERFKNEKFAHYDFYTSPEGVKLMSLRTKWTIVTYNENPIALLSEHDSWRLPNQMDEAEDDAYCEQYKKFRVASLVEGLQYLKSFYKKTIIK
jgi:hypothetical protein